MELKKGDIVMILRSSYLSSNFQKGNIVTIVKADNNWYRCQGLADGGFKIDLSFQECELLKLSETAQLLFT